MNKTSKFLLGMVVVSLIDILLMIPSPGKVYFSGLVAGLVVSCAGLVMLGTVRDERGWPVLLLIILGAILMAVMAAFIILNPFGAIASVLSFAWLYFGGRWLTR